MLLMSSCKSSQTVDVNNIYFPPVPPAFDEDGCAYVKKYGKYFYMPDWYWINVLEYMAETEDAIEELQGSD